MTSLDQNLSEVLKKNPLVDEEKLKQALDFADKISGGKSSMVKFDIIIPYASDSQGVMYDKSWVDIETDR